MIGKVVVFMANLIKGGERPGAGRMIGLYPAWVPNETEKKKDGEIQVPPHSRMGNQALDGVAQWIQSYN